MLSEFELRAAANDMIDYWHFNVDEFKAFAPGNFIFTPEEVEKVADIMDSILTPGDLPLLIL